MSDLPEPEYCECGYRVTWFIPNPDPMPDWYKLDFHMEQDVVELPCPHRNGTVIQYCPKCHHRVGIWGFGSAGGMECECWDARPWWRRMLDRFHERTSMVTD